MKADARDLIFRRSRPGEAAERRFATVLFADLVGSTDLIEPLDLDEAREILDRFVLLTQQAVHTFAGTIARVQGDGVLALFGAPVATEDHAQNACLAALEICRRVSTIEVAGKPLQVRVGIATGEIGLQWQSNDFGSILDVVGSTTHHAAKLQAVAVGGSVVISDATEKLLGPRFATRAIEGHEAFVLEALGEAGEHVAQVHSLFDQPIIGREEHLDLVDDVLGGGKGASLLGFAGSPGVGKSRLIQEIEQRAWNAGRLCLYICGQSIDRSTPFGAIASSIIRNGASDADTDRTPLDFASTTKGTGALDEEEWQLRSPDARNSLLIERCIDRILSLAPASGLSVIVDDFQFLDAESKKVLARLAPELERRGDLLVIGSRLECCDEIDEIVQRSIELPALSDEAASRFVRDRWEAISDGETDLPNTIGHLIQSRAQGLPLALRQFSDHCFELIRQGQDPAVQLPHELDTIFRSQIDALNDDDRALFQIGCVLGYEFSLETLTALSGGELERIGAAIDGLAARGFLAPLEGDKYRFSHQLFQEAGYLGIMKRQREDLHRRAYELLKQTPSDSSQHHVLGWHADRAGYHAEALEHLSQAMKDAIANGAILTVDDLYAQARGICARIGSEGRMRRALFLLHAFDALQQLGKQEWYRADIEDAAKLFAEAGDPVRTTLATGHLAITHWTGGRNLEALETAKRAHALAYETEHEPLMIYTDFALGNIEFLCGEPRAGIERLKALVERLGGEKQTARFGDMISVPGIMARTFSSWYLYDMGEAELAQEYCDQGRALAKIIDQNYSHVLAGLADAYLLYRAGDFAASSALLEKTVRRCHEQSIFGLETIACARLACSLVFEGRLDEAEDLLARHRTEGNLAPVQHSCAYYLWEGEARLLAAREKPHEALAILDHANAESVKQRDPLHELHGRCVAAEIRLEFGIDSETARSDLEAVRERAASFGFEPLVERCEKLIGREDTGQDA